MAELVVLQSRKKAPLSDLSAQFFVMELDSDCSEGEIDPRKISICYLIKKGIIL